MNAKQFSVWYLLTFLFLGWCVVTVSGDNEAKSEYVCTPCSNECDNQVFDHAGSCPVCGMPLVKKASMQSMQQSTETRDFPLGQQAAAAKMKIAIFLFDGVQIIDYTGPFEVFGHAGFEIFTVAENSDAITTAMGMSVNPRYTFANHPAPDILLLPGGNVPDKLTPEVTQWIQKNTARSKVVLSVCNGAFFLARTGLLDGLEATTFASLIDPLKLVAPKTKVVSNKRFVDNGKIITTAGLSSGIDGSLHVIEKLFGRPFAQVVATSLEYNWDPAGKYVRAALADRYLRNTFGYVRRYEREIVGFGGSTEEWTSSWKIETASAPASVLDSLSENLASADKWQPQPAKGANSRSWKFTGEDGQNWNGRATVEPVPSQPSRLLLTIKVSRATLKVAKSN